MSGAVLPPAGGAGAGWGQGSAPRPPRGGKRNGPPVPGPPGERARASPPGSPSRAEGRGIDADRLIVIGIGGEKDRDKFNWFTLGGCVAGKVVGRSATIVADLPGVEVTAEGIGDLALGARLRAYAFDRYKTKKKKDNGNG